MNMKTNEVFNILCLWYVDLCIHNHAYIVYASIKLCNVRCIFKEKSARRTLRSLSCISFMQTQKYVFRNISTSFSMYKRVMRRGEKIFIISLAFHRH